MRLDSCLCCGGYKLSHAPALISPFVLERIGAANKIIMAVSLRCIECGFVWSNWRPSKDEVGKLYANYRDESYTVMRTKHEEQYKDIREWQSKPVPYMDQVETFLTPFVTFPVSILDWGGHDGNNAPFAGRRILDVYDIAEVPLVEDAGRVESISKKYDLVLCANVLEHVPDPAGVLKEVSRAMDDKSILYIEVPFEAAQNTDDPLGYIHEWHEHINMFMPDSLVALASRCGLEPVEFLGISSKMATFSIVQIAAIFRKEAK